MTSTETSRKARGAFFTPPAIADYLAEWAIGGSANATVLDPTCGEAVFLLGAGRRLQALGAAPDQMRRQMIGIDVHADSLDEASRLLAGDGLAATLHQGDFFDFSTPAQLDSLVPLVDAVLGNPPFVRYQRHTGRSRLRGQAAALAQGVRLSGLCSSWAPLLVHAAGFLKPEGRLAMVLPMELLSVKYAEPVRAWLRQRFAAVHLVMFDQLQFAGALEQVVLLVAHGTGGCESFSIYHVDDAANLPDLRPFDHTNVAPRTDSKWSDLLVPAPERRLYQSASEESFIPLKDVARVELGTVTGANEFFVLTEDRRLELGLSTHDVRPIFVRPRGPLPLSFGRNDWDLARARGDRVWLLAPEKDSTSRHLRDYVKEGEEAGIAKRYKCGIRDPWWVPPAVAPPDLFFTYMSHDIPRLVVNGADATLLNSLHAVTLAAGTWSLPAEALALLAFNSVTLFGAELIGRAYGGGVLKLEPKEAAELHVPRLDYAQAAWEALGGRLAELRAMIADGDWRLVNEIIDSQLLVHAAGFDPSAVEQLRAGCHALRRRRLRSQ